MGLLIVALFLLSAVSAVQLDIHLTVSSAVRSEVLSLAALAPHNQIDFANASDPHVTLYLTDFPASAVDQVLGAAKKAIVEQAAACAVTLNTVQGGPMFALWNVELSGCLQILSDTVVQATYHLATPNQPIPAWINSLPPAEKAAKIAMIRKYGSPNVFSQFQPHVTVAYDTTDNLTSIYNSVKRNVAYAGIEVEISHVGPFGTVVHDSSLANISLPDNKTTESQSKFDSCQPSSNFEWDYFLLVREWPGTVSPGALPSYITSFTLHGLWPNRNDGSYPQCCNSSYPFSYAEIAPIIQDVDRIWYDTLHDQLNATSFWGHEWDKHGTCAMLGDPSCCSSERAYFETCISLHDQMTEVKWLAAAGIVPADPSQTLYKQSDFISAIQQGLGQQPLIKCQNDSNGNNVVYDLGVCIDKSLNIIACPENMIQNWANNNCNDEIGFPEIPH